MKTREMHPHDAAARPRRGDLLRHLIGGTPVLDLDYAEDSAADTDANFVLTGNGGIVEIQGTAEKTPFSEAQFLDVVGAGAQRDRQADRPAEAGGDVIPARRRSCAFRNPRIGD